MTTHPFKIGNRQPNLVAHEIEMLEKLNAKHQKKYGTKDRQQYVFENIIRVERDFQKQCFNVYFQNGEWFHYCLDGEVY
ncbi:hypothetical protein [Rummeliibacillus sp. POC4]|uniref:hypothetical protein n=1 Tax=Rummeliibacillus sp. POC4 TaxID=2305899 RepID=UPI000E661976|nr:hypothetical protein [Rummeliibacillus sp. POC4]RIJ65509.1 hypothetical protein D1606_08030 [Rummeliibacillus sp. POC4]